MRTIPNIPNSSAKTANIKSVCAAGRKNNFEVLAPRPLPKIPPLPIAINE